MFTRRDDLRIHERIVTPIFGGTGVDRLLVHKAKHTVFQR